MAVVPSHGVPICGIDGCSRVARNHVVIRYPRTGTRMDRPRCIAHTWSESTCRTNQALLVGSVVSISPIVPASALPAVSA